MAAAPMLLVALRCRKTLTHTLLQELSLVVTLLGGGHGSHVVVYFLTGCRAIRKDSVSAAVLTNKEACWTEGVSVVALWCMGLGEKMGFLQVHIWDKTSRTSRAMQGGPVCEINMELLMLS